jgi:hypothetical protein
MRDQEKYRKATLVRADGVVSSAKVYRPEGFRRSDHPVCGSSVASQLLISAAATPPFQGGDRCVIRIHSNPETVSLSAPGSG